MTSARQAFSTTRVSPRGDSDRHVRNEYLPDAVSDTIPVIGPVFSIEANAPTLVHSLKGRGVCHDDPTRDPASAASLLRRATDLQREAETLIQTLDLRAMLETLGPTELVGSVVSGLMVWRDIDFCVDCPQLRPERAWDALRPLLIDPQVTQLDYRNETGERAPDGDPTAQRLYLVLRYAAAPGVEWKIDLSLWTVELPSDPGELLAELDRRLTHETRLAILWIKDVWCRLPVYPNDVGGFEVYDAVLNHGVRTPDDFDRYLRQRGLPGRH